MRRQGFVGRTLLRSRAWLALAPLAGVLLSPGSASAQFGPAPSYGAASPFAAQNGPLSTVVAKFNGDSALDLAVVNQSSNSVTILLGDGAGGFTTPGTSFSTGALTGPVDIAAGDVNGDGKMDLVTSNGLTANVSVLLGNGDGTFQAAVTHAAGTNPAGIAIGEVTGDAFLDIVVANSGSNNLSVLAGDGNGGFAAPVNYAVGTDPRDIALAHLNGDGRLDVVVANFVSGGISVLLGNSTGTLDAAVPYATGAGALSVGVGKLDADANLDVVVTNQNGSSVSVLLGNGDGTLQAAATFGAGALPVGLTLGDFNVDGKTDVAVTNFSANTVTLLNGNGLGALQTPGTTFGTGTNPTGVGAADFDGDGRTDLVAANNGSANVSVLRNTLVLQGDLSVTKTDGQATAAPGTPVSYTITVSNAGPNLLSKITLTDTLPGALSSPVFTPATGAYDSGTGAWTGIALAPGGSVSMTVAGTVDAAATGSLANSVAVATIAPDTDPDGGNNGASDTDTLVRSVDLSVTKTDGQATAAPGAPVSYTITVSNAGPSVVSQLTLTDTLPGALTSPVFTPASGAYNSGTGAWTGITLFPGGSITMTLSGTINPSATGTLVNSVTVATIAPDTDPNGANNSASDTDNLVRSADLTVAKTDGQATATPGAPVSYTITVSNAGPSVVSQLTLTDTLPTALLTPVFTPATGAYDSGTGAWTGITLAPAGSVSMTVAGTVSAAATGNLVNSVTVATIAPDTDPNGANNSATDTDTLVRSADLTVANTDNQTTATPGAPVSYTITVSNAGPSVVSQLTLTDTLPGALTSPVFTPASGAYNSGTGAWTGITLVSGGSISMTLAGTVNPAATGTLVNSVTVATIAPDTDPTPGNNSATDTDTLVPSADLSITKTGPASALAGTNVSYTITVTNLGPSDAVNVRVADPTPTGLTFVSNSGDCATPFPCALGTVPALGTRTITATFAIPAAYAGPDPIQNQASVVSDTADPDNSDNAATASTGTSGESLFTLAPCRVLDTRDPAGPHGGPALAPGPARSFTISGSCGVPSSAKSVSINVTVTDPTVAGDLRIYPAGSTLPLASAINYGQGQTRANNMVVPIGTGGAIEVFAEQASGTVNFILDVNGYFE
jgi:uncharacterized repeat protein (TIGR01451 family)